MPVLNGLITQNAYRCCEGQDGLTPAEIISMGTISISSVSKGSYTEEEKEYFEYLSRISEEWIPQVPDFSDHSMILLPADGYNHYVVQTNVTTGEVNLHYLITTPHEDTRVEIPGEIEGENGEMIQLPENASTVVKAMAQANSVGIKITPIENRESEVNTTYAALEAKWREEQRLQGVGDPVITVGQQENWRRIAETTTPAIKFELLKLATEYIYGISDEITFVQEPIYTNNTTWTPEKLDKLGFLQVLDTVWSS